MDIDSPWDRVGCELAEEVLRTAGRLTLRANGSSMLPAIWPGDVLTIVRASVDDVSVGDVVLFARDGKLTAHRVIAKRGTGILPVIEATPLRKLKHGQDRHGTGDAAPSPALRWTTRGDSLPNSDRPDLTAEELLGRIVSVARRGRDVPPTQTAMGRILAGLCAHSDLAMRVVLKARLWCSGGL